MGDSRPFDNLRAETLAQVLAGLEADQVVPPPGLAPDVLAMFTALVAGNRSRPWNASHALALADYCRVACAWSREWAGIETEGSTVGGKRNPRFSALTALSSERVRLGKLLGINVGASDKYLAGHNGTEAKMRGIAGAMSDARKKYGDLLA